MIRPERPGDGGGISALLARCFPGGAEPALVDALRKEGHVGVSLVAEEDGRFVSHVLLSRMASPAGSLALGPIATLPKYRKRGLATALIRRALDEAAHAGWTSAFVLGEPKFYGRFGFDTETARHWLSPYAGDYFMALELTPGALAGGGDATYPTPFAVL